MELRDFVTNTLVDIAEGVRRAQHELAESGARVNPLLFERGHTTGHAPIEKIQFDVAVSVGEETGTTGKVNVVAYVMGVSGERQHDRQSERISRVQFTVPMVLPTTAPKSAQEAVAVS